jgi:hypothetical protein
VKELAGSPGGDSYETALRVLFDLDQGAVEAVTRADAGLVTDSPGRGGGAGASRAGGGAGAPEPSAPPEQEAR